MNCHFQKFESLPELSTHPHAREAAKQVDTHLAELRAMMLLPLRGQGLLEASLNFATAQVLLNLASGVSVVFMDPKPKSINGQEHNDRTDRLTRFLKTYYPWGGKDRKDAVGMLVKWFRHPGVHSLGFLPAKEDLVILKAHRARDEILELHESGFCLRAPKKFNDPTLGPDGHRTGLRTHMLYWGIVYAMRKLVAEQAQMKKANEAIRQAYAP